MNLIPIHVLKMNLAFNILMLYLYLQINLSSSLHFHIIFYPFPFWAKRIGLQVYNKFLSLNSNSLIEVMLCVEETTFKFNLSISNCLSTFNSCKHVLSPRGSYL